MNWIKPAAALFILAMPVAALAGSASGTVTSLYISSNYGDLVYIELSGVKTGNPACSSKTPPWQFLLPRNNSSEFYSLLFTLLQDASNAGIGVTVTGTGSCTVDYSLETIESLVY